MFIISSNWIVFEVQSTKLCESPVALKGQQITLNCRLLIVCFRPPVLYRNGEIYPSGTRVLVADLESCS